MMRGRRLASIGVGAAVLVYAAYAMLLVSAHRALVYPFHSQSTLDLPGFARAEVSGGAVPVVAWVHDAGAGAPVVVYFMGNVGALPAFEEMLSHHAGAGRSVVAMGYRGGGGVPGAPSEETLKADALVLVDGLQQVLPEHGPIVLHGYSMGTGLATFAASERDVSGVVLEAPYARLCEIMARQAYVPACWIPGVDHWRSIDAARRVEEPTLVVHGTLDSVIPYAHGQRMAQALPNGELVPVPLGGHDILMQRPGYLEAIDSFFDRVAKR
ncbi:alpha/beta hydrolase [Sagittula marina]|nr:alpha/beta hydrolase [Sagittula marina]